MYKYLAEKIKNKALEAPDVCLLAFESQREKPSEVFSDFLEMKTEEVCKVLGFKTDEKTINTISELIKDGAAPFAYTCMLNGKEGFLAAASIRAQKHIKTDDNGRFKSSSAASFSYTRFIYADTLGELTDKFLSAAEECFQKDLKKQNETRIDDH